MGNLELPCVPYQGPIPPSSHDTAEANASTMKIGLKDLMLAWLPLSMLHGACCNAVGAFPVQQGFLATGTGCPAHSAAQDKHGNSGCTPRSPGRMYDVPVLATSVLSGVRLNGSWLRSVKGGMVCRAGVCGRPYVRCRTMMWPFATKALCTCLPWPLLAFSPTGIRHTRCG